VKASRSGWKRIASPARSTTTVLALSKSHCRGEPPKNAEARTSDRRSEATLMSITSSAHMAREYPSTMTNAQSGR
jgi:hypothetical protein